MTNYLATPQSLCASWEESHLVMEPPSLTLFFTLQVAFNQDKIFPTPEPAPFRLTRAIVDGWALLVVMLSQKVSDV